MYQVDLKYNMTYQNIRSDKGHTNFYTIKCLKWQKKLHNNIKDKLSTKLQNLF